MGKATTMPKTTDSPVMSTFYLSRDELRRLQAVAAITRQSQTAIVRAAVGPHLDEVIKRRRIGKLVDELVRQQGK